MTAGEPRLLRDLDRMDVEVFAGLLARPTAEQQAALIDKLGEPRYRRMHELALAGAGRRAAQPLGNVVVIHGIMGGELSSVDDGGERARVWLHLTRLAAGQVGRMRLAADGIEPYDPAVDVQATGILKRSYGELILSLAVDWNVRAFWFDWRKGLSLAAEQLATQVRAWFGDAPVHIVAHSMGGLVARTLVAAYPDLWKAMQGRLVMLGTPNYGSFAIPQAITGLDPLVRMLAKLDLGRSRRKLLTILNSFPGTFQMLPSPAKVPAMEPLYDSATWGHLEISQRHLDGARRHHSLLAEAIDERMLYVAGTGVATFNDVDPARPGDAAGYTATWAGDHRVPHTLGLLDDVATWYVPTDHGGLTCHVGVLDCLTELLTTGDTRRLATEPPSERGSDDRALAQLREQAEEDVVALERLVTAGERGAARQRFGVAEEREIEDALVRHVLQGPRHAKAEASPPPQQRAPARILIRVAPFEIETVHEQAGLESIDVLATGHYAEVLPQAAERALDGAISCPPGARPKDTPDEDRILRGFTLRGVLRGRLGEPFLLPDPRSPERLIAIAGMGEPGRFGHDELALLARELCWTLGRLQRKHLATVVIGAGNGNLHVQEAIAAWLRGIRLALDGETDTLREVTFVEADPRKACWLDGAINELRKRGGTGLDIEYELLGDREDLKAAGRQAAIDEAARKWDQGESDRGGATSAPTRITLSLDGDTYRFGAITESAAVPERAIPVDPALVLEASRALAAEGDPLRQLERGQVLGRLLLPEDLAPHLATRAPLVMLLDGTTAAIHWEMVGQTGPEVVPKPGDDSFLDGFLGTRRGLTRQLRTRFAPPPEPPPPPSRTLRVLVIADPAADAHLAGAEEEGIAVADAFERFNTTYPDASNRVEVTRLLGPLDAGRMNVITELMMRSYDVLHFAGHCVYEPDDPGRSGWVFSRAERLTTNELSRIPRIPRFVFSNACESGVTTEDARSAHPDLAPTFAGAFFARGASEFVCTAWPVNDGAALRFACVLYEKLLGLPDEATSGDRPPPTEMHEAMRAARRTIAMTPDGARTWGAYQHYGNPHFKLFGHAGHASANRSHGS